MCGFLDRQMILLNYQHRNSHWILYFISLLLVWVSSMFNIFTLLQIMWYGHIYKVKCSPNIMKQKFWYTTSLVKKWQYLNPVICKNIKSHQPTFQHLMNSYPHSQHWSFRWWNEMHRLRKYWSIGLTIQWLYKSYINYLYVELTKGPFALSISVFPEALLYNSCFIQDNR